MAWPEFAFSSPFGDGLWRPSRRALFVGGGALLIGPASTTTTARAAQPVAGINIAGAEFAPDRDKIDIDYRYPDARELEFFVERGFRLFRIPFLAKRMFSGPDGSPSFSAVDVARVDAILMRAAELKAAVALDMHDYGLDRFGRPISARSGDFIATWRALAERFKGSPHVAFGLMNEPNKQSTSVWAAAANAAIAAIRAAGAMNIVLVPGAHWSTAVDWSRSGNAAAMERVIDPWGQMMIEVHQYLDADSSGTHAAVVKGAGASRLVNCTRWARENGRRAFLGEFGWADTPEGHEEGRAMLGYMARNADVWAGWAAWAAGKWWGDYPMSLEPRGDQQNPILRTLQDFVGATPAIGASLRRST